MKAIIPCLAVASVALFAATLRHPAAPLAQSVTPDTSWTPGEYEGWVYFEAKTDWTYQGGEYGATVSGGGVKFFVSHGDITCNVFDSTGNGNCEAVFPMDVVWSLSALVKTPECTANYTSSARADALSGLIPLAPLVSQPLEGGFSQAFHPAAGPAAGSAQATGCGGFSTTFTTTPGIPYWPDLDFQIGFHNGLSFGGTCSMKGLPRSASAGLMSATLSLDSCQWRAFYVPPDAGLP